MRMSSIYPKQSGFTLIELMVTMVVAMIVMAGMSSLFVAQTRTAQELNKKSEAMNDLFLAAQIMQSELRGAKAICWQNISANNKALRYQPLNSATNLTAACSTPPMPAPPAGPPNGVFEVRPKNFNGNGKPTPYICWRKPNQARCKEMIRDMKANVGITIAPAGNADLRAVRTITLISQYRDKERALKDLSLTFKIWPRNKQ